MKTPRATLVIAIGMLAVGFLSTSNATILVNSNFDAGYTAGAIAGQSGSGDVNLAGTWSYNPIPLATGETLNVVSGGINYSNGSVVNNGGANAVDLKTNSGQVFGGVLARGFTTNLTGQDVFTSIVLNLVTAPSNSSDLFFSLNNNGVWANSTPYVGINFTKYGAGCGGLVGGAPGNAISSTVIQTGDTVMLVAQYLWNGTKYDGVNFWLNPTSATPGTATASVTGYTNGPSVLNGLYLDGANLGTTEIKFDSFKVGTTFADVVTVPEPSTFALLALGVGFLAARRRKVG